MWDELCDLLNSIEAENVESGDSYPEGSDEYPLEEETEWYPDNETTVDWEEPEDWTWDPYDPSTDWGGYPTDSTMDTWETWNDPTYPDDTANTWGTWDETSYPDGSATDDWWSTDDTWYPDDSVTEGDDWLYLDGPSGSDWGWHQEGDLWQDAHGTYYTSSQEWIAGEGGWIEDSSGVAYPKEEVVDSVTSDSYDTYDTSSSSDSSEYY